ncbi:MAG: flagellar motor protein MotB [SAR324 cluster bacterium]|jgi:chemotaxis protein MotB|nr:flagellar motor protein MotB [SAR324 cluster bacterium]MCH2266504.1 flagellar motor protein MotB [SAR324 cluster bacterium]
MSRSGGSEGGWITTFADLMTLLFCFFVLLNALSTQPKNCGGLEQFLKNNNAQFSKYELRSTKLSCIVSLPQDFLFRSGDAVLKKGAYEALSPLFFQILKIPEHKSDLLTVEGHTDNVPMRSKKFPSNWELSSARATMIAGMLINRIKYPENSISIVGYADTRPKTGYTNAVGVPLVGSALKKARKINRRVEIVLTTPPKSIEQATLLFGEEN